MPDYKSIYNDVVSTNPLYVLAQNSPGLRIVMQSESVLKHLGGRSLDVGCGPGFAVEYLARQDFNFETYGVDISDQALAVARKRLEGHHQKDLVARLTAINSQTLPFEDGFFQLLTCFDVLEHLDETDIDSTLAEIDRVLAPGGTFLGAVSCRKAGSNDKFGDNLHRTVQATDWWIQKTQPDRGIYDGMRQQFVIWKRKPTDGGSLLPAN
jgi:ubiquinone/menaquinone biosynthesis C-methylase UbiE